MMVLDLILDLFIFLYTSLGFGTKEYKIEMKMEKIQSFHPAAYQLYLKNKKTFESNELLSEKVLKLNIKHSIAVDKAVNEIYSYFEMAS